MTRVGRLNFLLRIIFAIPRRIAHRAACAVHLRACMALPQNIFLSRALRQSMQEQRHVYVVSARHGVGELGLVRTRCSFHCTFYPTRKMPSPSGSLSGRTTERLSCKKRALAHGSQALASQLILFIYIYICINVWYTYEISPASASAASAVNIRR